MRLPLTPSVARVHFVVHHPTWASYPPLRPFLPPRPATSTTANWIALGAQPTSSLLRLRPYFASHRIGKKEIWKRENEENQPLH